MRRLNFIFFCAFHAVCTGIAFEDRVQTASIANSCQDMVCVPCAFMPLVLHRKVLRVGTYQNGSYLSSLLAPYNNHCQRLCRKTSRSTPQDLERHFTGPFPFQTRTCFVGKRQRYLLHQSKLTPSEQQR